jgi:hypothetical protein
VLGAGRSRSCEQLRPLERHAPGWPKPGLRRILADHFPDKLRTQLLKFTVARVFGRKAETAMVTPGTVEAGSAARTVPSVSMNGSCR